MALVLALVGGALALTQQRHARASGRAARIEALVGRADALRATQRDVAALLSVEAFRLSDTGRTRSALFGNFTTDGPHLLDSHVIDNPYGPAGIVLPDGETAFVVLEDGRLHPYDLDTGEIGDPWELPGDFVHWYPTLAAAADGSVVAELPVVDDAGTAFTVGLFDVASGRLTVESEPIEGRLYPDRATFAADGDALVVAVEAATDEQTSRLILVDGSTGRERASSESIAPLDDEEPYHLVPVAAALADGNFVVGSDAGVVRLLDGSNLAELQRHRLDEYTTTFLQPLSDGTVVGAGIHGLVRFDPVTGDVMWQQVDFAETCMNLRVIEEAGSVFCSGFYGQLDQRDLATGVIVRTIDLQNGGGGPMWSARGGTELVNFGNNEPVVTRWRLDGSGPVTQIGPPGWGTYWLSPNGEQAIVAHTDRQGREQDGRDWTFKVVDVATGRDVVPLDGLHGPTWADDDSIVAVVTVDGGFQVARVDVSSGEITPGGDVYEAEPDLYFEPGSPQMWVGITNDDGIRDALGGRRRPEPRGADHQPGWECVELHVRLRSPFGVHVRRTRSPSSTAQPASVVGTVDMFGTAYTTAADDLFVADNGGNLIQHDLDTLQPIRTFGGSRGFIHELWGTEDGTFIATKSDQFVTLFDVASGESLGEPIVIPTGDDIRSISIARRGTLLSLGGGIETGAQLWDLDPEHWVTAACRIAGRNLTEDEWSSYIGDLAPYHETCPGSA